MPTNVACAISCELITIEDVMKLTGYGKTNAAKIIKQLRDELSSQGKILPKRGSVPLEYFMERTVGCTRKTKARKTVN